MVYNSNSGKFNRKFHRGGRHDKRGKHGSRGGFRRNNDGHISNNIAIEKLTELEVGVTEYITSQPGFDGVIKQRFSDFQVNEISLDGTIAKLTDKSVPTEFKKGIYFCIRFILSPNNYFNFS